MKIAVDWTYDAPPDEVWAMTASTEFQDRKCAEGGALSYETSVTEQGDRTLIVATREMPTDGIPDQLRGLIGKSVTVTETQDWGPATADGSREARVEVAMKGQPVAMKGRAWTTVSPTSTRIDVEGDVKAKIPLIGGRIEKAVGPVIRAAIESEAQVGKEWLATHAG
ncbi:DUF2505 domain-containing protein [Luteipulveratus flavus]|uniref:DUF2505 domain-containing protein n=1 Tax=Luteipulveratus flavus TaxID=3031728 RepID=A0ABT6C1V9_9MICO|nr:DUF2505 domain-containing protein [Luteipulveratus sp. YIM 133296]MDF8262889.1 DUF2505 domain-containing protein [Luteipulveratus sp. YIM 133296]